MDGRTTESTIFEAWGSSILHGRDRRDPRSGLGVKQGNHASREILRTPDRCKIKAYYSDTIRLRPRGQRPPRENREGHNKKNVEFQRHSRSLSQIVTFDSRKEAHPTQALRPSCGLHEDS